MSRASSNFCFEIKFEDLELLNWELGFCVLCLVSCVLRFVLSVCGLGFRV